MAIDVDMNAWAAGPRNQVLTTDGVDSCIAVALSDPKAGFGCLGHFSDENYDLADEMIRIAISESEVPELWLWYGGAAMLEKGEPSAEEMNRDMRSARAMFDQKLRRPELRLRRRLWLPARKIMSVTLICGTDQCRMSLSPRIAY